MSYKFEEGKDVLIEAIVDKIKSSMSGDQADFCAEFAKQLYGTVAMEDLNAWTLDDLYGAVVNFWSLIGERKPHETKIRIYNPDFERHGWQTTHTVIEIICDDMPFLVDSIRLAIHRLGLSSHLTIHMGGIRVQRDKSHRVYAILPRDQAPDNKKDVIYEAPLFIEIDRQTDPTVLDQLYQNCERALEDNRVVFDDWEKMRIEVREAIDEIDKVSSILDLDEVEETKAFLHWIEDHHFTFLGMRDYELHKKGKETILQAIPHTGLGLLRENLTKSTKLSLSAMTPEAREFTLSSQILVTAKTNTLANVHRDAYTDYIGIKRFNAQGEVVGERRIIGLYTSAAYHTNPKQIPFLRRKVALIMESSKLNPRSHAGKILLNILETLPRDDLIQGTQEELLEIAMGIFYMQDRKRIRLFVRMDVYHRFVSCLVYVPKERINTELRLAMKKILDESFKSIETTYSTEFSESILARIHFIIKIDPEHALNYDLKEIEKKLIEAGRSWTDDLQEQLHESYGEEQANSLYTRYKKAFPSAYNETFSARSAVYDIRHIEKLNSSHPLEINFYKPLDEYDYFRLKVYQHDSTIPLSDVLPILEKLGLRAISERPYPLKFADGKITWINDFTLQYTKTIEFHLDEIKELFQNAFVKVWFGQAENDGFNQLVLAAGLSWREVAVLRAYAKYFKQIGITFSQDYIEMALNNNVAVAKKLVNLFKIHCDSTDILNREERFSDLSTEILADLDAVANLDEDKIMRQYIHIIGATLRTNFYQTNPDGNHKPYISIKLNSKIIPGLPKPWPMFEIFVYSPRFEAVHLRCAKVARGGLRWSDRREDFRTEILGLMKAQQVKNSVIVPSGAKGGFVPKLLSANATREEMMAEGISCYQLFIRGLLDITDNYVEGKVVKPDNVICYDEDDPYLVVAADKGTATFSDFANAISLEYGFWLGDAFASGGSLGYDHKKMGITAKGAWESVKRHFYELDINIHTNDFTVVGIGDMAGDVFGNGMLLSHHIQLVAAFNHIHIFIDPNPNAAVSFKERERLFHLPRSNWTDYDKKLISKGGGVFNRNAKSIAVSKEMREVFGLKQNEIEPNELIKAILKAKVDLLWSGGIGTYVKASTESNTHVGDKANDATRINGQQLRCKVIGEGGNLGLTQLGRVEYSLNGGMVYTDFIDNSAGVSCSDKEVNIKILLNSIVAAGDLTPKQRNELLAEMTDEVSKLVLRENFLQTRAISLAASRPAQVLDLQIRYINELERTGKIDRSLEYLPNEAMLMERKLAGRGLVRPSIAVLMCYSKSILKEQILASGVPEEHFMSQFLISSFPKPLQERFSKQMNSHPLKREIIATKLSNIILNEMGFTYVYRLQDETGAPVSAIVRAYMITRNVLHLESIWKQIEELGTKINSIKQIEIMMLYARLARRITRWFLRSQRTSMDISEVVTLYSQGIMELKLSVPAILSEARRAKYDEYYQGLMDDGIPSALAHELAVSRGLFAVTDITEIAHKHNMKVAQIAELYFGIAEFLDLTWIRKQIIMHPTENHWESLSREALRDDLDWQQHQLTLGLIHFDDNNPNIHDRLAAWGESHQALIQRWRYVLADLKASGTLNYTMFFVAIRELLDLTQTTLQSSALADQD